MMANGYITLNSKRYRLTPRTFREEPTPARQINTSLDGKTITQTFAYINYRWDIEIWTAIQSESATYGNLSDLRTAWALPYTTFVDIFGVSHSVVPLGSLPLDFKLGIRSNTAPFTVKITLQKRNT